MLARLLSSLAMVGTLCATPVLAQQGVPRLTADQFVTVLNTKAKPVAMPRTRSLAAGAGPVDTTAGAPGSGVVPDLQVQFNFNSDELTPDSKATLSELGKALQRNELSDMRFEIAGHTDAKGSDKVNETLSRKRAMAVTSYLEQNFGIDGSRLRPQGYGEKRLADPQDPNSGVNRRVEVRTLN